MTAKMFKALLPVLMVGGASLIALLLYANRSQTVLAPLPERIVEIDVAEVVLQNLRIPILAQGTVQPHRETALVSEVAGKIVLVSPSFKAGGYLAKDEILLKIDDRDYQAKLLDARAKVETAESALAQEKGRAQVAYSEWQRLPENSQRSQEATDLYLRKPQLDSAQAQLLSARADHKKAQDDLDRTTIRAPYNAIIRTKRSDLGQFVSPGTPVADIFSVDYAEVRLAIPQGKLSYLELPRVNSSFLPGQAPLVELYTDVAGEINSWQGRLERTEAVFDERSRVLFAVAQVEDPYALKTGTEPLRLGAFVKASILSREMHGLAVLPPQVLRAGNQVWVVDEQMTLRSRTVQTLRARGRQIYVSSGLHNGDLVNLSMISGVLPGLRVSINSRVSTLHRQDSILEAAGIPRRQADTPNSPFQALGGSPRNE